MADATLRFEFSSARWEYAVSDPSTWANLTEVTPLLQIARSSSGKPLGFVLDHEADAPEFTASLIAIERDFGIDIADRVRTAPDTDMEMLISTPGSLATKGTEEIEVMRPSNRLQAASSEVVITDDSITGVVTVTMTVPWWARFSKPWVAVRRRGKRDILLTGPLRVRGTTARATLRYGMPYSGSTLTADVVKGPRTFPWTSTLAALITVMLFAAGTIWSQRAQDSSPTPVESSTPVVALTTTLPESPSTAVAPTTTVAPTITTSTTVSTTTTRPAGGIEVQPSVECEGKFCGLSVTFGRGPGCMLAGDTFTQLGDGFSPEGGLPRVYFIPGVVQGPPPGGPVLRVPVTVVSTRELRGVVPQATEFPTPPTAGQLVSIVIVNGPYGQSSSASSSWTWCG